MKWGRRDQRAGDSLDDATLQLLDGTAKAMDRARTSLSEKEARILEYFWDARHKRIRSTMPQSVVCFFEADEYDSSLENVIVSKVNAWVARLVSKGYLSERQEGARTLYELTRQGMSYLKDQHPALLANWQSLIEFTPPIVSLTVGAITFIAAVLGIVEFFVRSGH